MCAKLSLVICDDDPDELLFFQFALRDLHSDYDIVYVSDGDELVDYLTKTPCQPDMIFLDNGIPGKSGLACLPSILKICPSTTAVIMHSCYAKQDDIQAAFQAGASKYMIKALRPNEFRSALKKVVTSAREALVARDWSTFCVSGPAGLKGVA